MTVVAYLLTLVLVPLLSAAGLIITLPLLFLGAGNFPRIVPVIQGVTTGIVAGWGCQSIFSLCGVQFSTTPIWIMAILFLFNDWRRVNAASASMPPMGSSELEEISLDNSKLDGNSRRAFLEIGQLVGTPIGFFIWVKWLS